MTDKKLYVPGQNVPIQLADGSINPVWYEILNKVARQFDPKNVYDFPALTEDGDEVLTVAGKKTLTGGFTHQPFDNGTPANGATVTVNPSNGLKQTITNNVAGFTIAATSEQGDVELRIINGSSAGTISFSGFSKKWVGDTLTTTNADQFMVFIYGYSAKKAYLIKALQ